MARPIRTAVLGVGGLGKHHVRWLSRLPGSQLVGLLDINQERADSLAAEYQIKVFKQVSELAGQVDAVTIVTPTRTHFELASECIEQGIHCLIEKPVTAHIAEAESLARLARKKQVVVTVGHIERFNPAVRALANYEIHPSFIEAHRLAAFDPRGTDVAVVLDLMIHDIDLSLSFTKSAVEDIQAAAVSVISEQADIANARLTFANGAVANLTASRISLQAMRKMRIFQKSGYFSLDLGAKQADVYKLAEQGDTQEGARFPLGKSGREIIYTKRSDTGDDMLSLELAAFLESIASDASVAVTLEEATEALRVALEVEQVGLQMSKPLLAGQK